MKNEEIAIGVVDCTKCLLRNDKSKCRCLNCFNRVETALSIKEVKALKDTKKYGDDIYNCAWRDGNNSAIESVIAIIEEFKI